MAPKLTLAVALAMPALSLAAALPQFTTQSGQIVGGEAAAAGEFPYIVSLSEGGSHFCGGTLLNANTVVTAAHCSVDQDPKTANVRAGTLTWASGGVSVGVASITVHPDFDEDTLDSDVAIWTLAEPIEESSSISYISLARSGSDPAAGSDITISGWGTTSEGGSSLPRSLLKVTVPVIDRDDCGTSYSPTPITDNMICGGVAAGGKDSCQGDSGGPVADDAGALVGIVSWGEGCARAGKPGVYTNVANFVSWINGQL